MPQFSDKRGFCTAYAHACGYLDSAERNGDKQFITMGAEGAVYFVRARSEPRVWETFDRTSQGRKDARKLFMNVIRRTNAKRFINRDSKKYS